jgi:hypothetical protein
VRIAEDIWRLQRARQFVQGKPEDVLRRVLDFIKEDLNALTPEERMELGYWLRWITPASPGSLWGYRGQSEPMPDSLLHQLQNETRKGIQGLLATPSHPWNLPTPTKAVLASTEKAGEKLKTFQWTWEATQVGIILLGIAHLVHRYGERLRACKTCQAPFLATKRQEYCTPICGQRMRDLNKVEKKKGKGTR